jgi:hypothetical protein
VALAESAGFARLLIDPAALHVTSIAEDARHVKSGGGRLPATTMSDKTKDTFIDRMEWDFIPLKTYESIAASGVDPTMLYDTVVLVRLINKRGDKVLARVLLQWLRNSKTDIANSPFGDKEPYYTGPVLQYIPVAGSPSYPMPELSGEDVYFPPKLEDGRDYVVAAVKPSSVLANLGTPSEKSPLPKNLVLRYTDAQGVVWKVKGFSAPPKGQTKPVIAWTDQYSEGDGEVIVEGSTYNEIMPAIDAFQASRKRKVPSLETLTPVPVFNLGYYLDNLQETFSDGKSTYKAYRLKDSSSPRERGFGSFYGIAETPEGTKVLGPSPKYDDLQIDLSAQGAKTMRMGLAGSRSSSSSDARGSRINLSSDDDGPKSLQGDDFEQYLPWVGFGLGVVALGTLAYMVSRKSAKRSSDDEFESMMMESSAPMRRLR